MIIAVFLLSAAGMASALSVGLGGAGAVQAGAGQGYDAKLQWGGNGSLRFTWPLLPWLDLLADADWVYVASSDIAGGYLYRGYAGGALALGASASAEVAAWKGIGRLESGGSVSMAGAFVRTELTSLYWFYSEVRLEGFLDFRPDFLPALRGILFLPLRLQLRPDMDYSLSAGVGFRVACSFLEDEG